MRLNVIKKFSDDINSLNPSLVGGKAFSLAGLYQKGFPIPDGFVITTLVFDSILSQIYRKRGQYKIYPEDLRQKIIKSRMPPELTGTIGSYFDSLNTNFVAVRSSASIEDGKRYSYAGQFDSFLGVNREDLLPKICLCWASFFGQRAAAYSKIAGNTGKMAVIVQRMIEADAAGVCFSMDPVTKDTETMIIESVSGPGELLVQGSVVPDRHILDKETLIIKEKHVNMNVKLDAGAVEEVAKLAVAIEKLYNGPVDVEWVLKDGKLYILQARPVTALTNMDGLAL